MKQPNLLVFVTDQQRADWLSCMGNPVLKTPNIDRLAERGVTFDRAYCNTPLCMPSRATMWTGQHASAHGVRTNGIDLDNTYATLPQILRDHGYRTASVGKLHLKSWHMSPEKTKNIDDFNPDQFPECETVWFRRLREKLPENYFGLESSHFLGGHGGYCFGEYLNWLEDEHNDAYEALIHRVSEKPCLRPWMNYYSAVPNDFYYNEWIRRLTIQEMDACGDRPFFLWCSTPDPHFPFGPPAPYHSMYSPDEVPDPIAWDDKREGMNEFYQAEYYESRGIYSVDGGPNDLTLAQIKETEALTYGQMASVDDLVGGVLRHLEETGKLEDTIIVYMSDHGELMGDHGLNCKGPFHYEGLLRVPLIISYPKKLRSGIHTPALASTLDFMPTVLDLLEIPYPENPVRDWEGPYPEYKRLYSGTPRLPGHSLVPVLEGCAETVQGALLIEDDDDIREVDVRSVITPTHKLTLYEGKPYGELFDLVNDPEERKNLWDDPAAAQVKAALTAKLAELMIAQAPRVKRRISIA